MVKQKRFLKSKGEPPSEGRVGAPTKGAHPEEWQIAKDGRMGYPNDRSAKVVSDLY